MFLGTWRYKGRRDEDGCRVCVICEQNAENEFHLLNECVGLEEIRMRYFGSNTRWEDGGGNDRDGYIKMAKYWKEIMDARHQRMT